MHGLIHLLLVLAMLACPLNCSGALKMGESAETGSSHCSCCSHAGTAEKNSPVEQPGSPADDDCNCGNCLCHGAVVNADQIAADFNPSDDGSVDPGLSPVASISAATSNRYGWSLAPLNSPIQGRCARIVHQSLLL
jgi:hypothetical protein